MLSPSADNTHQQRVLVVDDDSTVRNVVVDYLKASGLQVSQAIDGLAALESVERELPDLIVLDLMLPRIDGLEVFRRLRSAGHEMPVIMLTAKSSEADRILGLETGADDYVTKPCSPRELVLRVQSVLRRSAPAHNEPQREEILDGSLRIDLTARRAFRAGQELQLTMREFDLLAFIVAHPNQVLSREQLMRAVWGWDLGDLSTVTVHVRRIRTKIERDPDQPQRLVTVWGRGYRWEGFGEDSD